MENKIKVSIVGVTGYTGSELVRLLVRHPQVELLELEGRSAAGQPLGSVFPHLAPLGLNVKEKLERPAEAAFIFLGLPHHASAERAAEIFEQAPNTRIIDLSADFRLRNRATYEKWYGEHHAPYILPEAFYGLPELYRKQVTANTRLVANPGCYPTCSSLALAPALTEKIIEPYVIINALSGTSGAGRGLKQNLHYSEMHDSACAYGLEGHRHAPEITQILTDVNQQAKVTVSFTPHLMPLSRGMLATCSARLSPEWLEQNTANPTAAIRALYSSFYAGEQFVRIAATPPTTKEVFGSNYCFLYPTVDTEAGRLVVISVIDNLVKGAAGQAIQNMNLLAGLSETTGLEALGIYP
ncbi:N-acetyl-gamma-glutamyl-phosphate reductase [Candidatus Chlorohelix sp.]|uniref:N-acetyl-gamma-glutamyl-phosphate reductase n=1 Tax=Candidatus Chlorohelix sp. TaxID=3139201 RepID=UPI00304C6CAB